MGHCYVHFSFVFTLCSLKKVDFFYANIRLFSLHLATETCTIDKNMPLELISISAKGNDMLCCLQGTIKRRTTLLARPNQWGWIAHTCWHSHLRDCFIWILSGNACGKHCYLPAGYYHNKIELACHNTGEYYWIIICSCVGKQSIGRWIQYKNCSLWIWFKISQTCQSSTTQLESIQPRIHWAVTFPK